MKTKNQATQTEDAGSKNLLGPSPCSLGQFHWVTPKQWEMVIKHLRQHARDVQMDDLSKADAFVAAADFIKANAEGQARR